MPYISDDTESIFGLPIPLAIFGMRRGDFTDYETSSPGLGYSVAYGSRNAQMTLYIFDSGEAEVPTDLRSPAATARFQGDVDEILRGQAWPGHAVELRQPFELSMLEGVGPDFLGALVRITGPSGTHCSGYLLSAKNGKFVKLRATSSIAERSFDQWFLAVANEYSALLWPDRMEQWARERRRIQ